MELFSKMKNGSQSLIIAEETWFFSLSSNHGRHLQKNVYGNTSNEKWGDGKDKARGEEVEKVAMAIEVDTTRGQRPP